MESKLSISNSTHHWKSTLAWNVKCGVEKHFSIPHTWNCNTYVHTYSSLENAELEHCGELSGIRICIFCCKVRVDWKWKIVEWKVVAFLSVPYTLIYTEITHFKCLKALGRLIVTKYSTFRPEVTARAGPKYAVQATFAVYLVIKATIPAIRN